MDWNDGWNYRVRPVISYDFTPVTADGAALGTTAKPWSDAYFASGATINFDNGDVTLTHSANFVYILGGLFGVYFAGTALEARNDTDSSSVQVVKFGGGGRATPANNDRAYITGFLDNSANTEKEIVRIGWRAVDVTATSEDGEAYISVISAGTLTECFRIGVNYIEIDERTAPAAPAANKVRIFCQDNGAGKTQLMALFPSGVAQQIAIEP